MAWDTRVEGPLVGFKVVMEALTERRAAMPTETLNL
jgi:hypothetical protein